jgi:hypothetical protein
MTGNQWVLITGLSVMGFSLVSIGYMTYKVAQMVNYVAELIAVTH